MREVYPRSPVTAGVTGAGEVRWTTRPLLPHPLDGLVVERIALAPRASFRGAPHLAGSREYLACETGRVRLTTAAGAWVLGPGDVIAYRGDQRHGYSNPDDVPCVAYTVVVVAA
ncbi:MAG: cupin domain-containing protein [Myxococcota bacterium]